MKARVFSTVMLVVLLALTAVSGRSEAAPPTLGKPARVASFSCTNVTQIPSARILDGALPAEVQIRKNGNDAVNEWSHKDPNTEYDFHRKSEPYVPPSSATKLATLNPLSTAYTDEGALAFEGSYFYIVQSRFNDVTADSNETAAFTYALVKGIEEQDSLPTGASR